MEQAEEQGLGFGKLLRQHRVEAGLTQSALADRAGVSSRAVQYLEGRFGQPFPETVRRLAEALALSPEETARFVGAGTLAPRRRLAQARPDERSISPAREGETFGALPVQLTSFVGRERDLTLARSLLLRSNVRLLTLTGPPGTGKSRLALTLAETVGSQFADGAAFVSLAPLADPGLVAGAIGQALGLRMAGPSAPMAALMEALRDRELLLVLDNFEQLLPAAPQIAELLVACTGLKVLVTSRAALRIRGEHELAVPPLALPDPSEAAISSSVATCAAVELFVERAQAVRAEFALSDENAAIVAEICHRLDGLPLAIELAAARIRVLSPQAMLARLERRMPLLADGARDVPLRHRTLRNAIDWSYDLLTEPEQALFRRLAIFVGGCTLDAIEEVASCELRAASTDQVSSLTTHNSQLAALDVLASLTSKSMVQQGNVDGEPRLTLLETLREYGLEQLRASGELEVMRRRHAAYFLALVEEADPHLRGPEQLGWLDRLEAEHDNIRAALAWSESALAATAAIAHEDAQRGLRLVGALFGFWYLRGHVREGRAWMARLLPADGSAPTASTALRTAAGARAHFAAGWLALFQGDYAAARPHYEASVAIWRSLGDRQGLGRASMHLGLITQLQDDLDGAAAAFEESVALLREVGDLRWLALPLSQLGILAQFRGERGLARGYFEESVALAREAGDRAVLGPALRVYGTWHARGGDLDRAGQLYREGLTLLLDLRESWFTPRCLFSLAGVATARDDHERAVRLLGAADATIGAIGGRLYPYELEERNACLADARMALGEEPVADLWCAGQAMARDEAIAYALGDDAASP
ncbi:MAG: tetratricopeptide repeat protein [Chloroflexota bacterium]